MSLLFPKRRLRPEIMDQPGLAADLHDHALRGLQRINRWSGSSRLYWPWLRQAAHHVAPRPLRVLDLATGGGDIPVRLWHKVKRANLPIHLAGLDQSETAIAHAQALAKAQAAEVNFFTRDVLLEPLPEGYDVLLCSLFLHHFEEHQVVDLLQRMAQAAGHMILINDLVRGPLGYVLAYLGTRLLSTSRIVHADGPQSVAGAFTVQEMQHLADQAGLTESIVKPCWPFRQLLRWSKP